jgi:hypothetical protein
MRLRLVAFFLAALGLLLPSLPSFGHHGSNVVYDLTQSITVTGVVADFKFVNPHALIYLDVSNEAGETVQWLAGLPSASSLGSNENWTKTTVAPGNTITITGAPARGGAPSLWVEQITHAGQPLLRARYTG